MEREDKKMGWGRGLVWVVVLGLLAVVALRLRTAQLGAVQPGDAAPAFTLITFDGEEIGPEDMAGKVVVVNFWAAWCKPCEQEAAHLQDAWELYAGRGDVLLLGVDYADTERPAKLYLQKFDITYPNGPDLGTRVSQAFRITGVPETYVIGKDGVLTFVKFGPFISLEELTTVIDAALAP